MDPDTFVAGVALTLFVGFIANRLGFLSVHGRLKRAGAVASGKSSSGSDVKRQLY